MKILIKKIKELPDALHPSNISEGWSKIVSANKDDFEPPTIGHRFNTWGFSSSMVVDIIDDKTFKTLSSIYEWSILD